MELNVKKLNELLEKDDRPLSWLARQIGIEPQAMWERRKAKSVKDILRIAEVLKVKPEDLIVWETAPEE